MEGVHATAKNRWLMLLRMPLTRHTSPGSSMHDAQSEQRNDSRCCTATGNHTTAHHWAFICRYAARISSSDASERRPSTCSAACLSAIAAARQVPTPSCCCCCCLGWPAPAVAAAAAEPAAALIQQTTPCRETGRCCCGLEIEKRGYCLTRSAASLSPTP